MPLICNGWAKITWLTRVPSEGRSRKVGNPVLRLPGRHGRKGCPTGNITLDVITDIWRCPCVTSIRKRSGMAQQPCALMGQNSKEWFVPLAVWVNDISESLIILNMEPIKKISLSEMTIKQLKKIRGGEGNNPDPITLTKQCSCFPPPQGTPCYTPLDNVFIGTGLSKGCS